MVKLNHAWRRDVSVGMLGAGEFKHSSCQDDNFISSVSYERPEKILRWLQLSGREKEINSMQLVSSLLPANRFIEDRKDGRWDHPHRCS